MTLPLTVRQEEVRRMAFDERRPDAEIAAALGIAERTVIEHVRHLRARVAGLPDRRRYVPERAAALRLHAVRGG